MKKVKEKLNFKTILLLFYIIFTLIITIQHEPWRDEAQSWLIAKNLNPIEIIKQMKYEGHPCLWHLILYPLAQLNFPYQTINILSWALSCISATIIIKKSTFPKIINILILLTYPILYQYTAFARSYSLILLIISILLSIFPKRKEKPILYGTLVALLANTHILIAGLVSSLILIDIYEFIKNKKQKLITIIIELIGVLLLFLQLINSLNTNAETQIASTNQKIPFLNSIINIFNLMINNNYFMFLMLILSLIGIFISIRKQKKPLLILSISLTFLFLVNNIIYPFCFQHTGIIILIVLFSCILAKQKEKSNHLLEISLLFFLFSTIPNSLYLTIHDLSNNYSNAKDTASYINNNFEKGSNILCTHDAKAEAIIPYTNNNYHFFNPNTEEEFTYITWSNKRHQFKNYDQIKKFIQEKNINYIIHSIENNNYEINNLEQLGIIKKIKEFTKKTISEEDFYLYKVVKE